MTGANHALTGTKGALTGTKRAWPDLTPVTILTGFLGSGKTTLLARLLRDPALADSAVLINEFGAVGLDHHLVERIDETVVLLGSGCVCCTIRGELAGAIRDLESKRARSVVPPFRRLVIETSGLADPLPAITTITADPVLRHHFSVAAVVATVDAMHARRQLAGQPESVRQVAIADHLVLTKTDLCSEDDTLAVIAALRAINPEAPLTRAACDELDAVVLLGARPAPTSARRGFHCSPVDDAIEGAAADRTSAFALVIDTPVDWSAFGVWLTLLLHRHGDRILRVKGLLNVAESETPVAIHGVQQLVHVPTHLAAWPDADRRSKIVFITQGLDASAIVRSFHAFRVGS